MNIKDLRVKMDSILERVREILEDEQKKVYVIIGGTVLIVVLFVFLGIFPRAGELSKVSREAGDLRKEIDLVEKRVQNLDVLKGKLKGLREEQKKYSGQLPDEKEIPEFLQDLAAMAKSSDVQILSVTPHGFVRDGADGKEGYYSEMPIVITAKSGYHQLGSFISSLEQGERFVTVEDVEIQYDSQSPRRSNIKMVLKTYVAVENEKMRTTKK